MTKRALGMVSLMVGLVLAGCGRAAVPMASTETKATAKSTAFTDLQGREVSLSQFSGHPIVLAFLNPKRGDSPAEVPTLIRLEAAYRADGVVFVISGEGISATDLAQFAQQNELQFPVWIDARGLEMLHRGLTHLPSFEFTRRDGTVSSQYQGFMARGQLIEAIEKIRQ